MKTSRQASGQAYITRTHAHYPGPAIDNEQMDAFIAPLGQRCERMKRRILGENGILQRHYALDAQGRTIQGVAQMAAQAVRGVLAPGEAWPEMLAAATTGGDVSAPGLASMVHGELGLPPLKTLSVAGICASSIQALDAAVSQLRGGQVSRAVVVASEMPSRLFKKSRVALSRSLSFDAHFLRWMLSDGAGAWALQDQPARDGLSLRVDLVHVKSFAGDYPTCMQVGQGEGNTGPGYLDFDSLAEAEAAGAYLLRQDIRQLPNLFDVAVHEYARLVREGLIDPSRIDHFLAHYSSERFRGVMHEMMAKAGLLIEPSRWFSNLRQRGNMGSASIMTMLADFMAEKGAQLREGQQLMLFVPESGRFTVGYVVLTVVGPQAVGSAKADADDAVSEGQSGRPASSAAMPGASAPASPGAARHADDNDDAGFLLPPSQHERADVRQLLQDLLGVWHHYRSEVLRSPLARQVFSGQLTPGQYCQWMAGWIGQVRQGASWMRTAAANLPAELGGLQSLIELHASEEQNDWRVLFADYREAGGAEDNPDLLRMNPGAAALDAYIRQVASSPDAAALLGATYIIEGTGQRIVPTLLPHIRRSLGQLSHATRFLEYHGEADIAHMQRWMAAVEMLLAIRPDMARKLVQTARDVADLYALSWRSALT